jgi:hypothetical protein
MPRVPHLKIVDPATGEIFGDCPSCQTKEDELAELLRKFRGQSRELAELRRDKQADAEANKHWSTLARLFQYWQQECNHPRAEWSWERFEMALPYITRRKYGLEMCIRAICGAKYDPWKPAKPRRNHTSYVHDGWDSIFAKPGSFEEFVNKAPLPWECPEIPGLWPP